MRKRPIKRSHRAAVYATKSSTASCIVSLTIRMMPKHSEAMAPAKVQPSASPSSRRLPHVQMLPIASKIMLNPITHPRAMNVSPGTAMQYTPEATIRMPITITMILPDAFITTSPSKTGHSIKRLVPKAANPRAKTSREYLELYPIRARHRRAL